MAHFPIAKYRLAKRGGHGLACDQDGLTLGPAPLVLAAQGRTGSPVFHAVSPCWLAEVLTIAYGPGFNPEVAYRAEKLEVIARALTEGQLTEATIGALHLHLPELDVQAFERLALIAKYNPDQPRDWHGRWTTEGNDRDGPDQPASRIEIAGRVDSLSFCIERCWQILERPKPYRSSNKNEFDFRRCVNDCREQFS